MPSPLHIGLTYDLAADYRAAGFSDSDVAEFDSREVIDALTSALQSLGHRVDPIGHAGQLLTSLATGDRWDLVFNIAEGLSAVGGLAREAQVPTILDLYAIPYTFSAPLALALSLDKALTKRIARDLGIPTPGFTVVTSVEEAERVADLAGTKHIPRTYSPSNSTSKPRLAGGAKRLELPLFVKPIAEGSSKGVTARSIIYTWDHFVPACKRLLEQHRQPVLVERYLPGREFTVGILGTGDAARPIAALEIHLNEKADQGLYSFDNKEHWQDRMTFSLAEGAIKDECFDAALKLYKGLNCRDAGRVDVRQDETGRINVMELNPLPGLHPIKSDLPILTRMAGMPYEQLIAEIVDSARERPAPRTQHPGLPGGRPQPTHAGPSR